MTRGKQLTFGFGGGIETATNFIVISDAGVRPPTFNFSNANNSIEVPIKGRFSVIPAIDLKVDLGALTGSAYAVGEVQVWGDHWDAGKTGNIPVAIFSRYGTSGGSKSGSQTYTGGPGGFPWAGSVIAHATTIGVSAGYQPSAFTLWYGGLSRSWINADLNVNQGASSDGTSAGGSYVFSQDGRTESVVVGYQTGESAVFRFFGEYTAINWAQFAFSYLFQGGMSVDF